MLCKRCNVTRIAAGAAPVCWRCRRREHLRAYKRAWRERQPPPDLSNDDWHAARRSARRAGHDERMADYERRAGLGLPLFDESEVSLPDV